MLFSKQKPDEELTLLNSILDVHDIETVIMDRNCKTLLINARAKKHLTDAQPGDSCKTGYAGLFPGLCSICPNNAGNGANENVAVDIQDINGVFYNVNYRVVKWADGKPAVVIFLRDVNEERAVRDKLYNLAYIDQLTGITNRRKLKEDFDQIEDQINNNKKFGAFAMIDLDHFKTINDNYGHHVGDIMLKRLTGHLESDDAFKGHLYRLGGDELVLLFVNPAGTFGSMKECQEHYNKLLKTTLRSYTLPSIDAYCTLSIGISLFPWHGRAFSELMRKADIALYKAKEMGRNRLCFFEDSFDTTQKLKDIYIHIQPILDLEGNTFGYELIDQSGKDMDRDDSLSLNDYDRTMEAIGLDDLDSGRLYFIPYSRQLLNHAVARNLPTEKFIVGLRLRNASDADDIAKYTKLRELGYSLRLSGVNMKNAAPELLSIASYCSFDPAESEGYCRYIMTKYAEIQYIATDVSSQFWYEKVKKQGYKLFQGFYFKQPRVVKKTKEIDQLKVNYLRLLKLTSSDVYVDFKEISQIIASDVALTYKLLRLLNSAAISPLSPISSIPLAVSYLGENNLKKWIAMLAVRGVSEDKPMELVRISLVRARFAELLCKRMKPARDEKHVFLLGLLSLLDVALDMSKEDVFRDITVAAEIRDSLLTKSGPYSDIVTLFSDYEYAKWDEVTAFSNKNSLTDAEVNYAYVAAINWFNELLTDIS